MDYCFCSPELRKGHLNSEVIEKIHICAYPNQNGPEGPVTNHWVMFLQYGNRSVKVDMSPTVFTGGTLELSPKEYPYTNRAIHIFSVELTRDDITIEMFCDLIDDQALNQYHFTDQTREGCRGWIHIVIEELEDSYGCFSPGTAEKTYGALSYFYGDSGKPVFSEIKYGCLKYVC